MSPLSLAMYIHYHTSDKLVKYKKNTTSHPGGWKGASPFVKYKNVIPNSAICAKPIFREYPKWVPTFSHPAATPSATVPRARKIPTRARLTNPPASQLYIIRRARQLYIDFFTQTIHNIRYAPFKNQHIDVDNIPSQARPQKNTILAAWIECLDRVPGSINPSKKNLTKKII